MKTALTIVFFAALLLPWILEYFRRDNGAGQFCDNCDGEGYLPKPDSTDNTPCKKCGGKGYTN
jgi:hypothetical protein